MSQGKKYPPKAKQCVHNTFYVTDAAGNFVNPRIIEDMGQKIGSSYLKVKEFAAKHEDKIERAIKAGGGHVIVLNRCLFVCTLKTH